MRTLGNSRERVGREEKKRQMRACVRVCARVCMLENFFLYAVGKILVLFQNLASAHGQDGRIYLVGLKLVATGRIGVCCVLNKSE